MKLPEFLGHPLTGVRWQEGEGTDETFTVTLLSCSAGCVFSHLHNGLHSFIVFHLTLT